MKKQRRNKCTFCKSDFPESYQVVSNKPKYWLFILNRAPQTDFHSLIVFKAAVGHISSLNDRGLPDEAMTELGILLKKACISIKKADRNIERILIISLNTGKGSQHLHFHLVPTRRKEPIRMVNKPREDGGGMFFLGRKEIVVDTFPDFLKSTTGNKGNGLIEKINTATKYKVKKNAQQLRTIFENIWVIGNKQIHRTADSRR